MSTEEKNQIPEEALRWKVVEDYLLRSPLGQDICQVEMLDSDEYKVLRPGEDERIRKAQVQLFCEWLIQEEESFEPEQLRYIFLVLETKQSVLAKAMALTEGSMSQFLANVSKWKASTHRHAAVTILQEIIEPGSMLRLANNHPPTGRLDSKEEKFGGNSIVAQSRSSMTSIGTNRGSISIIGVQNAKPMPVLQTGMRKRA